MNHKVTGKKAKPGHNKGKRYEKPISLYPLTLTAAIRAIAPVRKESGNGKDGRKQNGD